MSWKTGQCRFRTGNGRKPSPHGAGPGVSPQGEDSHPLRQPRGADRNRTVQVTGAVPHPPSEVVSAMVSVCLRPMKPWGGREGTPAGR